MNTDIKHVFEARLLVGPDPGDGVHAMQFRFPDGTLKQFEATAAKQAEAIAEVVMEWVKGHAAASRDAWIAALKESPSGSQNHLLRVLLEHQAQADKTGKWPWKRNF